jgi:alpha-beta hydrolase superfamily lysophospholipase
VPADILPGYEAESIFLSPDWQGAASATLVRWAAGPACERAVLYVHGYNDYFFCAEMGPRFAAAGWAFYALDLRKHGRSLQVHQTPSLVRDFGAYYEELSEAVARIRGRDGARFLLLAGHSTGGVVAPLFAQDCPGIDALFLNSPFLAFRVPRRNELLLRSVVRLLGRFRPEAEVQREVDPRYAWSLHRRYERGGEWVYDEVWKRPGDLALRAGFIRASARAHDRIRAGLGLLLPVLVGVSADAGGQGEGWDASWHSSDTVLDPKVILRRARRIGPQVESFRLDRGLHDLMLSAPSVRDEAWARLLLWMSTL